MDSKEKIKKTLESSDSETSDSENSEVRQSVRLMAKLEQERNPENHSSEGTEPEPQSRPSAPKEMLPNEEWSKMSKTQRKHFLRKRRETRGEVTRTSREKGKVEGEGKRPRDTTGFTPSPRQEERKKPRIETASYSHMLSCIKVAITNKNHPQEELTQEYCDKLIIKLMDLMCENNPEDGLISFCGYSFRSGAIVVNCVDDGTRNWLNNSITNLTPWEGTEIKTCDPKELEGFKKISMFIPKPLRKIKEILTNLKKQNGIDTDRWKILPHGTKEHPSGVYFVASIPESHYDKVQKRNNKLSHGFHLVEVKELGKAQEASPQDQDPTQKTEGKEETRVESTAMEVASGGGAVEGPVTDAEIRPDRPVAEPRASARARSAGGRGTDPAAGGGGQDVAPGAPSRGAAAGGSRGSKKSRSGPGRDPPPKT